MSKINNLKEFLNEINMDEKWFKGNRIERMEKRSE